MDKFLSNLWPSLKSELPVISSSLGVNLQEICSSIKKIIPEAKDTRSTEGYLNLVLCGDRYGTGRPSKERWYPIDKKAIEMFTQALKDRNLQELCGDQTTEQSLLVLLRVVLLLGRGFHLRIVDAMLRCATGGASNLGNDYFDQKFQKAYTDQEFRKALWGVEDLLPIKQIAALTCGLYKDSLSRVKELSV